MKQIMKSLLAMMMAFSLIGCGQKDVEEGVAAAEEAVNETVEVDEGLLNVTITLPASFFEMMETTAEEYVAQFQEEEGQNVEDVKMNDDGSVDITMSRVNYEKMMADFRVEIDNGLQEIVDDTEGFSNITAVDHNDDYSEFNVTLESGELGLADSMSVIVFYMYGGFYNAFSGENDKDIVVNFVDKDGNIVNTGHSSDLDNTQSE